MKSARRRVNSLNLVLFVSLLSYESWLINCLISWKNPFSFFYVYLIFLHRKCSQYASAVFQHLLHCCVYLPFKVSLAIGWRKVHSLGFYFWDCYKEMNITYTVISFAHHCSPVLWPPFLYSYHILPSPQFFPYWTPCHSHQDVCPVKGIHRLIQYLWSSWPALCCASSSSSSFLPASTMPVLAAASCVLQGADSVPLLWHRATTGVNHIFIIEVHFQANFCVFEPIPELNAFESA